MANDVPTVSAVLATYEGSKFIEEQIDSILLQTCAVSEIVISDDASDDDTIALAERALANTNIRTIIVRNVHNIGFVANFERGLRAATGDVVVLSDQDDTWLPRRVEYSVASLGATRSLVFGDALINGEDCSTMWDRLDFDQQARHLFSDDPFSFLMRGNVVMGASTAFTRDLLDIALPIPRVSFHDYWLACIAAATGSIRPLEEPVLNYRQHDGNASGGAPAATAIDRARGRLSQSDYIARRTHLEELRNRLEGVEPDAASVAARGVAFLGFRDNLPPSHAKRIGSIASHLMKGDYHRFSRGIKNAAYDMLR